MMVIELNLANLIFIVFGLLTGFWALVKVVIHQYERSLDKRFSEQQIRTTVNHEALEHRLVGIEAAHRTEVNHWQRVERELLNLKADLPIHYLRREDYIRGQSIIEAKLDGLASKLESTFWRALKKGDDHGN